MTFWCGKHNSYTHAEEWHSFAYRRLWLKLRKQGMFAQWTKKQN